MVRIAPRALGRIALASRSSLLRASAIDRRTQRAAKAPFAGQQRREFWAVPWTIGCVMALTAKDPVWQSTGWGLMAFGVMSDG